jgi:hypothetical protein
MVPLVYGQGSHASNNIFFCFDSGVEIRHQQWSTISWA